MNQQAKIYYKVGNDFLKKQLFPQAIQSYLDAIRFDQNYVKAYSNLGVAYKLSGLLKEAERTYMKALKLKPNNGIIFNNLGNV